MCIMVIVNIEGLRYRLQWECQNTILLNVHFDDHRLVFPLKKWQRPTWVLSKTNNEYFEFTQQIGCNRRHLNGQFALCQFINANTLLTNQSGNKFCDMCACCTPFPSKTQGCVFKIFQNCQIYVMWELHVRMYYSLQWEYLYGVLKDGIVTSLYGTTHESVLTIATKNILNVIMFYIHQVYKVLKRWPTSVWRWKFVV